MNEKSRTARLSLIATALLALSAIASPAQAQSYAGELRRDNREIRQDNREIYQDRQELRSDYRELAKDRADYLREKAQGDIAGMRRERAEIAADKREIRRDQAELRRDLRERRQDMRQDHRGDDWRQTNPGHDRREGFREARHAHAASNSSAQGNWPGRDQPSAGRQTGTPTSGNNGKHIGWQQGRGNSHRG